MGFYVYSTSNLGTEPPVLSFNQKTAFPRVSAMSKHRNSASVQAQGHNFQIDYCVFSIQFSKSYNPIKGFVKEGNNM